MIPRSLLLVSYYFPPLGLSGVQRPLKLAKYLHRLGWRVYVLTVKPIAYWQTDETLLADLPPEVLVFRTDSADPARLAYLLGRKERKNVSPAAASELTWDSKMGFFPFAYWKAVRLIKKFGIEVVWTTSPPPSIHRVGVRLKQKLRVRWVADFRDPWSGESPLQGAPLWSKRREKLKNLLAEADWVTCVDDPIKNFLGELAGFEKVSTVFNGYDQADLPTAGLKQHEIFTLAYGGTLNLAHDPHLFLKGLSTWKKKRGVSFKLILVGRALGLPLEDWLDELDLTENTVLTGYLSHRRALQRLSEADLFLLFVAPEEKYRFTLTAKIFEYIGLGRPVLAVAPRNGAVADFLAAHPVGMLAGDEEAVVKVLEIYHRQWQLEKNLKISEEVRRRFGWDKEAAKLSAILEGN